MITIGTEMMTIAPNRCAQKPPTCVMRRNHGSSGPRRGASVSEIGKTRVIDLFRHTNEMLGSELETNSNRTGYLAVVTGWSPDADPFLSRCSGN